MQINPYVIFDGQCREAFTTYERCLGGKVTFATYGDVPPGGGGGPQRPADQIMHAHLVAPGGAELMGSDGPGGEGKDGVWVSINVDQPAEAERIFGELSQGGAVVMPIGETFWALRFGMLKDRFGVSWMVNCSKTQS